MKLQKTLFFVVIVLAFFLRFYRLDSIPWGLEQDETSIGYNAYSVLQTGKDEYGKTFPLSFKAFGEYKLPGYIYASVLPIKFFGLNEFSVRFISALSGSLTVIVLYFLVSALIKKPHSFLPLLASGFLAINPWSLHLSRGAFETALALFFITFGAYLWIVAVDKKKTFLLFISLISLFASVYTYNIARVFTPLLFVALLIFSRHYFVKLQRLSGVILFAAILCIPLAIQAFGSGGVAVVKGTLITSSPVVQAPMIEMRDYMMGAMPQGLVKLLFNMPLQIIWHYLNNVISYFSVDYLFVSGSTHGNHGIGTSGQFYLFEALFILIGIVEVVRKKYSWGYLLIAWIVFVVLIASLTREVPQATRSLFMVIPLEIFSAFGLLLLLQCLFGLKRKNITVTSSALLSIFIAINLIYYFTSYYVRFPIVYAKDWRQQDKALSQYLMDHGGEYRQVIFDNNAGFEYTSYLFYTKYSPTKFQTTVKRAPDDSEGFSQVLSFGTYQFKDIDWNKDYQKGTLIVTTMDKKPSGDPSIMTFSYPVKQVAFAVKNSIISYPVTDVAYVLVAKK